MLASLSAMSMAPPHSGFHMKGKLGFEGWYTRLTIPDSDADFAFIYSVFDGADERSSRHGVGTQIIGPGDRIVRDTPLSDGFWADEHDLALGHTIFGVKAKKPMAPRGFQRFVKDGFQLTGTLHQGVCRDASWSYQIEPQLGWGGAWGRDKQYSTAGWLAALPVFEPHYQVLMAHGLASGHVCWRGQRYDFVDAPVYAEKNWGNQFPARWFWMQCNSWDGDGGGVVSLTCAGGRRGVPVIGEEDVAMIALHTKDDLGGATNGRFHPFPNVRWAMGPWGSWRAEGSFEGLRVLIEASCDPASDPGVLVAVPTADGMVDGSRETFEGRVRVRVWRCSGADVGASGPAADDPLLIDTTSQRCALELGGGPWDSEWIGECAVNDVARAVLSADPPLERIREFLPGY